MKKQIRVVTRVIKHNPQFSRLVTIPLETDDEATLTIRLASEDLPEELQDLLRNNRVAKSNWEKLTPPQQRMLREDIFAAKSSTTRRRRAEKLLI
jgi:uncharacterized protein YdeI (YjbR/CyaY-like superfamily)